MNELFIKVDLSYQVYIYYYLGLRKRKISCCLYL